MERLWNRNYCKVMAANFSLFFAFYVLTPLLPLYLSEHFGATKDMIGLVLSGYTITALVIRPFSGYMVDSFPRKIVLMVSFGAFALCRLSGCFHLIIIHDCANAAWRTFWCTHDSKRYGSHRRTAFQSPHRGHRLLWSQQQSGDGPGAYHRHLRLSAHTQL